MQSDSHATAAHASDRLRHLIDHLAHFLPAQGPIGVFIHHNTLHAFQHKPFEEAVVEAARMFGNEPYWPEAKYREAFEQKRIRVEDIDAVLKDEPDRPVIDGVSKRHLMRAMLVPGIRQIHAATVRWEMEEGFLQDRDTALLEICRNASAGTEETGKTARPRDGVLQATGVDIDDAVHPLLIRLSAAYLDQGLAYWTMPDREFGFWSAVLAVLSQPSIAASELSRLPGYLPKAKASTAEDALIGYLHALGVQESQWEEVLLQELLALPGWAGLMRQLEVEPELAPHERLRGSLLDFLAVRMLLTVAAVDSTLSDVATWQSYTTGAAKVREDQSVRLARAAQYAEVARLLGLSAAHLSEGNNARLFCEAVDEFPDFEQRRLWHFAYERRHERQVLLPLMQHAKTYGLSSPVRLAAQVFFCIDEREESIRRHLEEIDPEIETLGAAGFFGVAMNYAGIDDAHGVSLCPVVVKPQHAVRERPSDGHDDTYDKRLKLRKRWATLMRHWSVASRTLVRGWLGTTVLGVFSLIPMAARILSPRQYARLIHWLNDSMLPEPRTELTFMRSDDAGHHATEGLMAGFTVDEKVDRVASVLGPAGLHKGMARLVVVLGHGSTSLNNPHESAHDCGACGGRRGGPNGRIFAAMANHPEVRVGLRQRGIHIPEDTWFVGGYHDTCNDDVDLYDLDQIPASHRSDLARVRASLDKARALSAHERARRFHAARPGITAEQGLQHVQERAEHLAEPRPEYGHCTNAVCVVGRRSATRNLFFDRRAFLVSYDASLDPSNDALGRMLGAVIPVCGGISLEYYFSSIDNERYGCGTKLPHNITGLVGVMNGYEGDLRTGLPWQMVEIHEPVRILFVIESTPDRVLETIRKNPLNWEFLNNRWIRVAAQDPSDGTIYMYRGGEPGAARWERMEGTDEVLLDANSSMSWYDGKMEHLPIAHIFGSKTTVGV